MAKTRKGEGSGSSDTEVRDDPVRLDDLSLAREKPEAESATTEPGLREVEVEFAGANLGEDELAEQIAEAGGNPVEEAESEVEELGGNSRRGYEELVDDDEGDEADPVMSAEDRLDQARPDGLSAFLPGSPEGDGGKSEDTFGSGAPDWWQSPLKGYGEGDPTGSFTDYVEDKTGIDEGTAENAGGGPAPGSGRSVADGGTVNEWVKHAPGTQTSLAGAADAIGRGFSWVPGVGPLAQEGLSEMADTLRERAVRAQARVDADEAKKKADEEAQKKADEEAKKKADEEAKKKADEEAKKKTDEEAKKKTEEEAKKDAAEAGDPGPDAPYRATLEEKANDPLFQQYQESKNAGGGGDGATDPTETDDGMVLEGALTQEQIHEEAVGRFGQPPPGEDFTGDRDVPSDHGYWNDPNHGAIDPTEDQYVAGPGRTEDPADATAGRDPVAGMPADDSEGDTDEGGESLLPDYDILGPVDDPAAEVPDYIDVADVPE